ncbi:MAG: DUF481 domain-containing protein, partial [Acidobacteriota bacterium]
DVWIRRDDGWKLSVRHSGAQPQRNEVAAQYGKVPQPPPLWDVRTEFSLAATGGNTSTRTVGAGGSIAHRAGRATTDGSIAFLTSDSDGVTRARSLAIQARHGIRVRERLEGFGRGGYARDRFAGIDDRVSVEAGAAYAPSGVHRHAVRAEAGLGFTIEQRLDATELRFATAAGAVKDVWTFAPGAEFVEDAGLIVDLEAIGNWRASSTTALRLILTRALSLRASHALEYRNTPVGGFGRLDLRTDVALVLSFQRRPRFR